MYNSVYCECQFVNMQRDSLVLYDIDHFMTAYSFFFFANIYLSSNLNFK